MGSFTETFDDSLDSSEYTLTNLPQPSGGELVYSFSGGSQQQGTLVGLNEFTVGIAVEFKFQLITFPSTTRAGFHIESTVSGYLAQVFITVWDAPTNSYNFRIETLGNGGSNTVSSSIQRTILPNTYYWLRFIEVANGMVRIDWKVDGGSYSTLWTQSSKPTFDTLHPFHIKTTGGPYYSAYQACDYRIDTNIITATYSDYTGDWYGDIDCDMPSNQDRYYPHFFATSGDFNLTYHDEPAGNLLLNTANYLSPMPGQYIPPSNTINYWVISASALYPLTVFAKISGNLTIHLGLADASGINTNGEYMGVSFTVNGVSIDIGLFYDSTSNPVPYWGCIVDGVYYNSTKTDTYNRVDLYFELIGNHCQIRIKDLASEVTVFDDTDFLASPAQYISEDFVIQKISSSSNYKIYEFTFLGETPQIVDLSGDLSLDIEQPTLVTYCRIFPPTPSNPGYFMHRTALTGGTDYSVDGIDPTDIDGTNQPLLEGSAVWVITDSDDMYLYRAYQSAGKTESLPNIIIPDNNPGNWYWQLVKCDMFLPAKIFSYTDLSSSIFSTYDDDYREYDAFASHVDTSNSNLVTHEGVYISGTGAGIRSQFSDLSGKTSVLVIPYNPIRNQP